MAKDRHIYGEVDNKADLEKVFSDIRRDVGKAKSRPALTELYKRAGYLITLTHAHSWEKKFGRRTKGMRKVGVQQFHKTAHKINRRAEKIGSKANFDESWGK